VSELGEERKKFITPIEITENGNSVKIIFKPLTSAYLSAKEEKDMESEEEQGKRVAAPKPTVRKNGYLSPEQEKKLAMEEAKAKDMESKEEDKKKKKKEQPEGGLEVFLENSPYLRIRVRRCNMGPNTVVKEESEKYILTKLERMCVGLDNDKRIVQGKK
jgi:hypothetical protein